MSAANTPEGLDRHLCCQETTHMQATSGYSADTEILTRRGGWVTFDQLTYMDEVATRSPDGRFEWQVPERIRWERYDGDMVWLHGRALDLLITPNHKMTWAPDNRYRIHRDPASHLLERSARIARARAATFMIATSTWDAPNLTEKVFPGVRRTKMGPAPRTLCMTGDQFAAFMGMYIAEGCVGHASHDHFVDICQMVAGKGYEEYRVLLAAIWGREPGRGGNSWRMHSRPLYEYLQPLGKAINKRLPPEVLNLSRRQLEIFYRYYFLGDGSFARPTHQVLATASKMLADALQEVVQKLGGSATIYSEKYRPTKLTQAEGIMYKLGFCRTVRPAGSVGSLPYSGMVGSVQVDDRPVYVRRSRRPFWI